MALNVIMFPSIIIGAISIILVPVISEASSGRSKGLVNRRILSTIKVTTAIAALSAALFFSIPDELGRLFYNRDDLGSIIFSLSFGVIFIYIESTLFGILNGLGKQGVLLRNTIIMSVIDITVLYTLLGIPAINIYGYGINFVVSPLVGCILNALEIRRVTDIEISLSRILLFPLMVAAAEGAVVTGLKKIVFTSISNPGSATVLLILVGIGVYIILYLLFDPYSKESL
jgi:stage V sporulation protein B